MSLTCSRCLSGQPSRCLRGDCANWNRRANRTQSASDFRTRQPATKRTGKPGRQRSTSSHDDQTIAEYLVVGSDMRAIVRELGYTIRPVMRVKRELLGLQAQGITAGPVELEPLPSVQGKGGGGRGHYGARVDPEAGHKAALLLIEGATLERTAHLTGITWNQARTVRTNLRVLAGIGTRGPMPGAGGAPRGIRAGAAAGHRAALLLLDGATLGRTAELTGISVSQARTVRRNLNMLADSVAE